jgi:prophage regulatory protein
MTEVKATNKPSAQVEPTRKAAALKAATAKLPQPAWLRPEVLRPPEDGALTAPQRVDVAHRQQALPHLLDKHEVCAIANVSFPTIWSWMRAGTFPRSRVVGGKSMWLSSEIDAWLADLPVRCLKGDAEVEVA